MLTCNINNNGNPDAVLLDEYRRAIGYAIIRLSYAEPCHDPEAMEAVWETRDALAITLANGECPIAWDFLKLHPLNPNWQLSLGRIFAEGAPNE